MEGLYLRNSGSHIEHSGLEGEDYLSPSMWAGSVARMD